MGNGFNNKDRKQQDLKEQEWLEVFRPPAGERGNSKTTLTGNFLWGWACVFPSPSNSTPGNSLRNAYACFAKDTDEVFMLVILSSPRRETSRLPSSRMNRFEHTHITEHCSGARRLSPWGSMVFSGYQTVQSPPQLLSSVTVVQQQLQTHRGIYGQSY